MILFRILEAVMSYKDNYRNSLKKLKIDLGGKCLKCGCTELFKLEFDHIDPTLKTKQITKISKENLKKELLNIQLLCNMCHRIKTYNESEKTL
jgi:hypothetical protein